MQRSQLWAILAAVALVAAACGGSGDSEAGSAGDAGADSEVASGDGGSDAGTDSDDGAGARADDGANADDGAESDDEAGADDDSTSEAATLDIGGPVGPGVYTTDLMGTEVVFDFDRQWVVPVGDPGGMVFADPATESATAEVILLTRMNSLAGPGEADVPPDGPAMSGPSNDLGAWIEAVDGLIVEGPTTVDLEGASAVMYDVRVDPDGTASIPGGCGPTPDDRCFFVGGTGSTSIAFFIVRTTEVYRMWMIDQGGEDGLLVTAIAEEDNPEWLDDAGEAFVSSLAIGEPAPHPVEIPDGPLWEAGFPSDVPAGVATFPAFGGLTAELPEDMHVHQDGTCIGFESLEEVDAPFSPSVRLAVTYQSGLADPVPIQTVDDFVALARPDAEVTETGETISVFDTELVGYSLFDPAEGPPPVENQASCAPKGDAGSNQSFFPGPYATVFLGEYDGGVLTIFADGFTEEHLVTAEELLDQILPTLALTE